MNNSANKNNMLTGYLQLFLVFQIINLVLTATFFLNLKAFFSMISSGGAIGAYSLMYVCISIINITLSSLVIFLFLKKYPAFIKIYIISTAYKIILSILNITFFWPLFSSGSGFFNVLMAVLGIVFDVVMLYFWLNFFKTSTMLKVYLKGGRSGKKLSWKDARARKRFKVIK